MLLAVLPAIPQRDPRCRSILLSSSATRSQVVARRYRCVQCGTANVTGVQTACHSRSPTNPGRPSPPRHRHYPHKCPTHRGFVQSGFCEVALHLGAPNSVVPRDLTEPSRFPLRTNSDSPAASEGTMRPKKHERTGEEDLFRARLDQI